MSDNYDPGDWDAQCFRCGFKRRASTMRKQWQGFWVCQGCWEPRHPQDFVKAAPDNSVPPWTQPESWTYVGPSSILCTIPGSSAVPGYMNPGCSIPNNPKADIF